MPLRRVQAQAKLPDLLCSSVAQFSLHFVRCSGRVWYPTRLIALRRNSSTLVTLTVLLSTSLSMTAWRFILSLAAVGCVGKSHIQPTPIAIEPGFQGTRTEHKTYGTVRTRSIRNDTYAERTDAPPSMPKTHRPRVVNIIFNCMSNRF